MSTAPPAIKPDTPEALLANSDGAFVLQIADRCDRCGAQAYVAVRLNVSRMPVFFCAHHFRIHEDALEGKCEVLADDRYKLMED